MSRAMVYVLPVPGGPQTYVSEEPIACSTTRRVSDSMVTSSGTSGARAKPTEAVSGWKGMVASMPMRLGVLAHSSSLSESRRSRAVVHHKDGVGDADRWWHVA